MARRMSLSGHKALNLETDQIRQKTGVKKIRQREFPSLRTHL